MKLTKVILPLMLLTLGLGACTPDSGSNTAQDASSEIIPGVTVYDYEFNGYTTDSKPYASHDYHFSGILEDISIGAWVVVGDVNTFSVDARQGLTPAIKVEFEHDGIIKHEIIKQNDKDVHALTALKTGGTTLKIYAEEDGDDVLIFRNVINARVAIKDNKVIFDKLAEADYWEGVFTNSSKIGDFRLMFNQGEEGIYNDCTVSLKENAEDHGIRKFIVDLDSGKEAHNLTFHIMSYTVNTYESGQDINPVTFDVSLALDMIYLSDKDGLIDFFRPVRLGE